MTTEELIMKTLKPLGYLVKAEPYTGDSKTFITYMIENHPSGFGDNEPMYIEANVTVALHIPIEEKYTEIQKQICRLLDKADFTYPSTSQEITNDNATRIIFFDCQYANFDEV